MIQAITLWLDRLFDSVAVKTPIALQGNGTPINPYTWLPSFATSGTKMTYRLLDIDPAFNVKVMNKTHTRNAVNFLFKIGTLKLCSALKSRNPLKINDTVWYTGDFRVTVSCCCWWQWPDSIIVKSKIISKSTYNLWMVYNYPCAIIVTSYNVKAVVKFWRYTYPCLAALGPTK